MMETPPPDEVWVPMPARDGGPAFPLLGGFNRPSQPGMSLRAHIATAALPIALSIFTFRKDPFGKDHESSELPIGEMARVAVMIADALIAELEKK